MADACIFFMNKKIKETLINIGTGKDYSIKQYAGKILKEIIPKKKLKLNMIIQNQMVHQEKY